VKYKFNVICSKDQLKEVGLSVSRILRQYSISEVEINELVLAVDEVCANLIIHSHQCNADEFFELNIHVKKAKGIIFEFIDSGKGFNITKYKEPSINDVIKEKKKGGIGLMLVRRIMDKIEFEEVEGKNIYRLHKFLKLN